MQRAYCNCKWLFFCVMALVFLPIKSAAQESTTKAQIFSLDGQTIQQQYNYKGGKDSIANGPFALRSWPSDSSSLYQNFVLDGFDVEVSNGKPAGAFLHQRAKLLLSSGDLRVRDYHLSLPTSGTTIEAVGQFAKGLPAGPVAVKSFVVTGGAKGQQLFEMTAEFNRVGRLQNQVVFQDAAGRKIDAFFDADGRPHGKWTLPDGQSIYFEKGLWVGLGEKPEAGSTAASHQKVKLNTDFLWWLQQQAFLASQPLDSAAQHALQDFLAGLSLLDFQSPLVQKFVPFQWGAAPIEVALPVFDWAPEEQEQVAALKNQIAQLLRLVDNQKNFSPFYINHFKDQELAMAMLQLQLLERELLFLGNQLDATRHELARLINRQALLNKRMLEKGDHQKGSLEFKDAQLSGSVTFEAWKSEGNYWNQLASRLQEITSKLENTQSKIHRTIAALKVENDLQTIDNQLVDQSAHLKTAIENFSGSFYLPRQTQQFQASFAEAAQKAMEAYADYEGPNKLEQAQSTMECLTQLLLQLKTAEEIAANERLIYKAYHSSELNPVTWTHMETIQHERIYDAYIKKLVPYFFDALEAAAKENCGVFQQQLKTLVLMQQHLLHLETQNPVKINRKLRANDGVTAVLQKINFEVKE